MAKTPEIIKGNLNKLIKKETMGKADMERGKGILKSLIIVINVLYGLMIFQTFLILPRTDDPDLKVYSLGQIFSDHTMTLVTMGIGFLMLIIYWIQFNRQLGNLVRSSPMHASLAILQMVCLMLYLYFLRFDIEFDGMILALQMESVFLALAGFIGAYNWMYARKNKLTSAQINDQEEKSMLFSILPEPIAAIFSLPFAQFGATLWSISFLIIIPLSLLFKYMQRRNNTK